MKTRSIYNLLDKDIKRFYSKAEPEPRGHRCRNWLDKKHGKHNRKYGCFRYFDDGKRLFISAHRIAYFLAMGLYLITYMFFIIVIIIFVYEKTTSFLVQTKII